MSAFREGGGLDLCLGEVVRSKVGASRDALCQDLLSFRNARRGALVVDDDNFNHAILLYIIRYLPMILKRNRFFPPLVSSPLFSSLLPRPIYMTRKVNPCYPRV